MKIYTKTGDQGQTALLGGKRVAKSCLEMMAIGEVDELNSSIGLLVAEFGANERLVGVKQQLVTVQHILFNVGANLAAVQTDLVSVPAVTEQNIFDLETWIDAMETELTPLTQFILPGGGRAAAQAFVARSICRRAERQIVLLNSSQTLPAEIMAYVNRLSDALFVLGRFLNHSAGAAEVFWHK